MQKRKSGKKNIVSRIPGVEPGADEAFHSLEVRVIDVTATPYPIIVMASDLLGVRVRSTPLSVPLHALSCDQGLNRKWKCCWPRSFLKPGNYLEISDCN